MPEKHFYEQKQYTQEYLLPYFQKYIPDFQNKRVLEVGCAEGGLLDSFQSIGMDVYGLELSPERANLAKEKNSRLNILVGDITDPELISKIGKKFDLIIMREVIEHVRDKESAFNNLNDLLNDGGYLFISFPPKRSPFAGHQQIGRSYLKMIPYLHILPASLLKSAARAAGESSGYIDEIKLHFSTGCTIYDFDFHYKKRNFRVIKKDHYLFRPIYAQRFGIPTIKLPKIPLLQEYITFGCETLLKKQSLF